MPPPSQADTRYASRKPHPLSLVPLSEVFTEGTAEHTALRRDAPFVPPLAHRRGSSARPLEVRVRSTITSITDIDFEKQTFTCSFFLDASWVSALRAFCQPQAGWQSQQRRTCALCAYRAHRRGRAVSVPLPRRSLGQAALRLRLFGRSTQGYAAQRLRRP